MQLEFYLIIYQFLIYIYISIYISTSNMYTIVHYLPIIADILLI